MQWHRTLGHGSLLESWGRYYVLTPEHEREGSDPQRVLMGLQRFDVFLQPLYPKVVFVPQETAYMAVPAPSELRVMGQKLRWGPSHEVRYSDPGATGIHYEVYLDESRLVSATGRPFEDPLVQSDRNLEPYLQHPAFSKQFRDRADGFARDHADPMDRARAVETWLRTNLGYTTSASREVPEGVQPVDAFLFDWREGNCEYFSTAMVMLLRASDVPARNITGFIGGAWNDVGDYLAVREADAHSWVEVYEEGEGWVLFDPTPPSEALPGKDSSVLTYLGEFVDTIRLSWHKRIIAYDLTQQADLLRRGYRSFTAMRGAMKTVGDVMPDGLSRQVRRFGPLLVLAIIVIVYLAFRKRRNEPPLPLSRTQRRAHRKALDLIGLMDRRLEEQGLKRPASRPPLTHARLVSDRLEDPTPLGDVVEVYNSTRFGGNLLTSEMFSTLKGRIATIRRQNVPQTG
jgi:transglutaminase-like putative cysteine protease